MTNYYELLEVSDTASSEVIRAAYKAGVKRYHPDNYTDAKDKKRAMERLKLLNEALEILTDERLRAEYDEELAEEMNFFRNERNSGTKHSGHNGNHRSGGNVRYDNNAETNQNSTYSDGYASECCSKNDLTAHVEGLIVRCKNESEYLDLRDLITKDNAPETEKLQMLSILDEFTKVRLQQELLDESKLEDYRKEVKSLKWGLLFWMIVGIGLSSKFWWAFWAAVVLCIAAYYGAKDDRNNLARAEYAVKHIAIYRMRGFKI